MNQCNSITKYPKFYRILTFYKLFFNNTYLINSFISTFWLSQDLQEYQFLLQRNWFQLI